MIARSLPSLTQRDISTATIDQKGLSKHQPPAVFFDVDSAGNADASTTVPHTSSGGLGWSKSLG